MFMSMLLNVLLVQQNRYLVPGTYRRESTCWYARVVPLANYLSCQLASQWLQYDVVMYWLVARATTLLSSHARMSQHHYVIMKEKKL